MIPAPKFDFLLTKVSSSGGSAKQSAPLDDFALGSWKTGGRLPLLARIKPVRHWQLPGPKVKPLQHDSEALQQAVRQGLPVISEMQRWVRDAIRLDMTPPEWDALLSQATQRFFPKVQNPPVAAAADTLLARRMWRTRRLSATSGQAPEVDNAIKAINSFVAYKVLRKLRPWQPSQKAQLKDSKRFLLSPAGELDALRKYATDVSGKYPRLSNNFVGLPPLDSTLLAKHIASIKPGKAVPSGTSGSLEDLRPACF